MMTTKSYSLRSDRFGFSLSLALLLLAPSRLARAAEGEAASASMVDKSGYSLIKPTPREYLREMTTDRPDKTESPFTLDAGHFQIEMDLVTHSRDHDTSQGADTQLQRWAIAPVNLKVGLLNSVDLQVVIDTYEHVRVEDRLTGAVDRRAGFGDVTTRLKWNLFGNDGGSVALGVMPFVKFPTSQDQLGNNSVEGGLIVPVAFQLPAGFDLCLMTEFDFLRDDVGRGHHVDFINTATISHDLVGKLGAYLEFFSLVSSDSSNDWQGSVDIGLTYAITADGQLDAGVNLGVTDSADDVNPFLGISWRF